MDLHEILKFDPAKHPRYNAGEAGGKGGQFAPRGHFFTENRRHHRANVGLKKDGDRWVYEDTGEPVSAEMQARITALKVRPAWTDVKLNVDPEANLQVLGRDVKGREQYLYSAAHSEQAAAEKFERLKAFHASLPVIRKRMHRDIDMGGPDADIAQVLHLIDVTGFRIGSETDTGADVQAFGATTLLDKHVVVNGDKIRFSFIGKKGVKISKMVKDERLARIIERRKRKTGKNDQLFPNVTDAATRTYLKKVSGEDFQVKDFRTHHGTAMALGMVKKMPVPKSKTEMTAQQKEVAKAVSEFLGNTPAVALKYYIDPAVFKYWVQ